MGLGILLKEYRGLYKGYIQAIEGKDLGLRVWLVGVCRVFWRHRLEGLLHLKKVDISQHLSSLR